MGVVLEQTDEPSAADEWKCWRRAERSVTVAENSSSYFATRNAKAKKQKKGDGVKIPFALHWGVEMNCLILSMMVLDCH